MGEARRARLLEEMDSSERRDALRQRVLKAGKVVLANNSVFDCAIRNISSTGAQIRIVEPIPLPEEFSLYWPEDHVIRPCENRWQHGTDCGVSFIGPERRAHRCYD